MKLSPQQEAMVALDRYTTNVAEIHLLSGRMNRARFLGDLDQFRELSADRRNLIDRSVHLYGAYREAIVALHEGRTA